MEITRKELILASTATVAMALLPALAVARQEKSGETLTLDDLRAAAKVAGVQISDEHLKEVLKDVTETRDTFPSLRKQTDDPFLAPSSVFRVLAEPPTGPLKVTTRRSGLPTNFTDEDLAFLSVAELGRLVKSGSVTSVRLTRIALGGLRKYGPKLRCVITVTEELAMRQAERADEETASGMYRGPLHGIPYGLKDLFAVPGYPTTWGAAPYRDQRFKESAAVFEKLTKAGAVLVAKLSMGALAEGDKWFGGRTESPWDPTLGSSGSSAGSGSAVAAGLVAFAIGTETSGSIVSPSHNCRVTGLRPTFGSVSRYGAMALSWSMDKVGPLCRTAEDCALVLAALLGSDARDPSSISRGFRYSPGARLDRLRVGVFVEKAEVGKPLEPAGRPWLEVLAKLGARLQPATIEAGEDGLGIILVTESAAAFDSLTRSERLDELAPSFWPKTFRQCRLVPGVEMVLADRYRRRLQMAYEAFWKDWDVLAIEDQGYPRVYQWNLTGHPQVLVPMGVDKEGKPKSLSLVGPLFSEARLLAIADEVQRLTGQAKLRPDMARWA